MRVPRVRQTLRRLMVSVLVIAVALWWCIGRPARFLRIAAYHEAQWRGHTTTEYRRLGTGIALIQTTTPRGEWHKLIAARYKRAASWPWRPLPPDPPQPLPGQVLMPVRFGSDAEPYFDYPGRRASRRPVRNR